MNKEAEDGKRERQVDEWMAKVDVAIDECDTTTGVLCNRLEPVKSEAPPDEELKAKEQAEEALAPVAHTLRGYHARLKRLHRVLAVQIRQLEI